jgi:hypothetical protein
MNTTDIEALRIKHQAALEKFDKSQKKSDGITKIPMAYKASTLAQMLRDKRAIRWDGNRDEVKARLGTDRMYMNSLANKRSTGLFVAFWNGTLVDGKIVPTVDNPLVIYEGGHRSRWLDGICNGTTEVEDGLTLEVLRILRPVAAKAIDEAPIKMDVNVHESGVVPEDYVKQEYEVINTTSEGFSLGESVSASTDEVQNELDRQMKDALGKRTIKPKNRDADAATIRSLTHGSLGMSLEKTKKSLLTPVDISKEQQATAEKNIEFFKAAEDQILQKFLDDKKTYARVKKRGLKHAEDATVMFAIADAPTTNLKMEVVKNIVKFYEMFFPDNAKWKEAASVFGGGSGKHYSDSDVFRARWRKIVALVNPPKDVVDQDGIEMPMAV